MVAEVEAVGDMLTGAALARAVEPETGEGQYADEKACLNCQTSIQGAHCHGCGQKAHVHRTLRGFGHDILHGVFHFDGKIWRTLPMLAWNPGELTRRYVHGERAKFVSPIALFLFMVFLSFAVFTFLSPASTDIEINKPVTAAQAAKAVDADRAEILSDIAKMEAEKKEALAQNQPTGWIDSALARHRESLRRLEQNRVPEVRKREMAERKFNLERQQLETEIQRTEAKLDAAKRAKAPTTDIENDLSGMRFGLKAMEAASGLVSQRDGNGEWTFTDDDFWGSASLNNATRHASENPQLLLYKIQSNAYKFSWALIPISIPFVWLLFFWRRQFKMFDHAVFVTYSLSFMMALGAVSALILNASGEDSAVFVLTVLALMFLPPIHMYRQLHHAYQATRFGAAWRTLILSNFTLMALILFASLILALGVTG